MSIYAEMQGRAKELTKRLNDAYRTQTTSSGLFSFFYPPLITLDIYHDSILIERVAYCLDRYPKSEEEKHNVLKGIYSYILKKYDGLFSAFNKTLLKLLLEDLNIKKLADINEEEIRESYAGLGDFRDWVYDNCATKRCKTLFKDFPDEMPLIIAKIISKDTPLPESSPMQCGLLNWLSCSGTKH